MESIGSKMTFEKNIICCCEKSRNETHNECIKFRIDFTGNVKKAKEKIIFSCMGEKGEL